MKRKYLNYGLGLILAFLSVMITPAYAQSPIYQQSPPLVVGAQTGPPIREVGSGVVYHTFSWWVSGTINTCQVKLEGSTNGVAWFDVIASQSCLANGGPATVTQLAVNFVRVNVSTLTGTGNVVVAYTGTIATSSGGGGGAVTIADGADVAEGGTTEAKCPQTDATAKTMTCMTAEISAQAQIVGGAVTTGRLAVNPISGQAGVAGGTGVDAATVQRVSLATNVPLPAGTNPLGSLTAGSALVGKVGIDQTTPGSTNLVAIQTTAGGTISAVTDPCWGVLTTSTDLHLASATVTPIITATSAKKNYICSMQIGVGATAEIISLVEGTGGACGGSTAVIWGSTTAASGFPFGANSGINVDRTIVGKTTNVNTCVQSSGTNAFTLHIEWVQQ